MSNKQQTHTGTVSSAQVAMLEVQKAVSLLTEQRVIAEQRKAVLLARCAELYDLPLGVADIRQFMNELIDYRAQHYAQTLIDFNLIDKLAVPRNRYPLANQTPSHIKPRLNLEDAELALGRPRGNGKRVDVIDGWNLPIFMDSGEFQGWPYFFFGDVMKEKIGQLMDAMKVPPEKPGPKSLDLTMDERRREIQAITLEVNALDADISRIQSEINSLTAPIIRGAKGLSEQVIAGV